MAKTKLNLKTVILTFVLASIIVCSGCSAAVAAQQGIRLAGPGDLYYLSVAINQQAAIDSSAPAVDMQVSSDSINELKKGETDAVLLGREPTSSELQGLNDYVIAYDAVCIIIDQNTYLGGAVYSGKRPIRKSGGLVELPYSSLAAIFSRTGWPWGVDFYNGNPNIDDNSFLLNIDSVAWIPATKSLVTSFYFPPGKYDTQTVIYQKLGLDEQQLLSGWKAYTLPQLSKEEEILSYEYNGTQYSQDPQISDFPFKLAFASRRAMTVAPDHVPVKVVSIDGVDPLKNPQSVYDGSYPFSRKIHLLTRQNSSNDVNKLADFLRSAAGQQLLSKAGYLPLAQ
ncbi:MAG: substrate-binding domain-containing protein [Dehalococcoidales bacterium]